jgi:hypothetical protein
MTATRALQIMACGSAFLVLAACGSSSSKTGVSSPPSATSAATGSTSASSSAAGQARLAAIVAQQSDLPAGWSATAYQADPSSAASQAAMLACVGEKNTDPDKVGEAHSSDYSQGQASISSQAASYKSQSDIDSDIAVLKNPKISSCYEQLIKTQVAASLPQGTQIKAVSITITPGSGGGPANVVATGTGTVTVSAAGGQASVYLDVAFITGPKIEAEADFENIGSPVAAGVRTALIAAIAGRAANG